MDMESIARRPLEAAVLVLLIGSLVLLFLRRRPAGLVWYSALVMVALAAHLYGEHARWQMIPAYVLTVMIAFRLARPAGQPYRSARPYGAPGLILRALVVLVAVPSMVLPFVVPLFRVADPTGPHRVGHVHLIGLAHDQPDLRIWYPASASAQTLAPFWTAADVAESRLPGLPRLVTSHLALVPTPAGLRAPIVTERLPVLVVMPGPCALPSDYLHITLEAASAGWMVVVVSAPYDEAPVHEIAEHLAGLYTDGALAGRADADRLALLVPRALDLPHLDIPVLTLGGGALVDAALPSGRVVVEYPGASIPASALTVRHLFVRPSRLLVDAAIPPDRIDRILRRTVAAILGDGSRSAPVFSAAPLDEQLAATPGLTVRVEPGSPRRAP